MLLFSNNLYEFYRIILNVFVISIISTNIVQTMSAGHYILQWNF